MKNIFLTLILALFTTSLVGQSQLTVQISSGEDDQEEFLPGSTKPVGGQDVGSSDLELGSESTDGSRPQLVGLRFTNIDLPQGALVLGARIVFTVDEPNKSADPSMVNIRIQDADNAEAITSEAFNLSTRATLADAVSWSIPAGNWPDAGTSSDATTTPDLSALVQAIVSKGGWATGNALLFTIEGTGTRTAESYDGSPSEAARLVIDYIAPQSLSVQVAMGTDDQEEVLPGSSKTEGDQDVGSSDLELGSERTDGSRPQLVGVRFGSVDIPKGALIVGANIQFTIDEADKNADPASVIITAEDADNPSTFNSEAFNISSRPTLEQSVTWNIPDGTWTDGAGVAGPDQRTPDLAALVQGLINRDGWEAGNAMAFMIQGTGTRTAESYDGSPTEAPVLNIQYIMSTEYRKRVAAAEDDLEEYIDSPTQNETVGSIDAGSSDLEFGNERQSGNGTQLVGIRFRGLDIPKGAVIQDAYIQFTVDETDNADPANLTIKVQDADNAPVFANENFNISSRPTLAESVDWSLADGNWNVVGESGPDQRTPNIASLLQSIVNREGWEAGNAVVFTIAGTGTRTAESYDGSPDAAAELVVSILTSEPGLPVATYPIAAGQPWSYNLEAVDNWTAVDFDDTEWEFGPTPLGYGFDGINTEFAGEPKEVYLRKRINIPALANVTDQVGMAMRVENGAEVYVNGMQVAAVSETSEGDAEQTYFLYAIDKTMFVEGVNVVAVKVSAEDNMVFDAALDNIEVSLNNTGIDCPEDDLHISCFESLLPIRQNDFIGIPESHDFQYIAREGDPYIGSDGTYRNNFDFTGYVPIDGSSTHGYLSINYETTPGGVSITEVKYNESTGLWENIAGRPVDFSVVQGTARNCSGAVTPWGTIITCEETTPPGDVDGDGYIDIGWCVEIDPVTASVVDYGNGPEKLWALGRMSHENVVVADDRRTVYFGEDTGDGSVYKFVADEAENLSSGDLYVLKLDGDIDSDYEPTTATGTWVPVPNNTPAEANNVKSYALNTVGATTFSGVEDVEISPADGMIYFAVKGNAGKVYRFMDSDSTFTNFETFVGGQPYVIESDGKQVVADWFGGQDNLTFDDRGNLYVLQDGGNNYIWLIGANHTQDNPAVEIFFHTPNGAEPTGMTFTPDFRYMFMSVQHPSAGTPQEDVAGVSVTHNREVAIVIAREEFLGPKKIVQSDKDLQLFPIGTFQTGIFDEGAAEIVAHDPGTQRAFFTNADANSVSILDISQPSKPAKISDIDMSSYGGGVNSVTVHNGVVAVAVEAADATNNGSVVFFDTDGMFLNSVTTGALPDMITFTPDGTKVLTADEGQPNDAYTVDPEGSVTIIDVSGGAMSASATTVSFTGFNADSAALTASGVRIFGPGATVAQDLEPEYIAISTDNSTAYVVCQENNAIVTIDLASSTATGIVPLGYKNHSMTGNGFDASNRSADINIRTWPTLGMYQPDAIKIVNIEGADYIVSANEGDSRDYDGYSEETRVEDLTLDTTAYPDAASLQMEENLGRLKTTTATGDTDGDGDIDQIYSYGARSFSIWDAAGNLVFDSGDNFEQILSDLDPDNFNANNDDNDSYKSRSDDKGPEPEAVEIVELDGAVFALIGLERMGGIMIYEITDPRNPKFVRFQNNRNFSVDATSPDAGDLGVEDLEFITAEDSPIGIPLVLAANEVSGTVTIYSVNDNNPFLTADFALRIVHNNDGESKLLPTEIDGRMIGGAAEFKTVVDELRGSDNLPSITLSSGDNFLAGNAWDASLALPAGQPYYDAVIMDSIGYDAVAIGNHDFDFGPDILERFILSYENTMPPYLSANLDFSGEPGLQALYDAGRIAPRTIIEKDGEQIGVIGLIYDRLGSITSPRNVTVIPEVYETVVTAQVDSLKAAGVNKIILISHLQSINRELEIAGNVTDIDVIIAGGGDELLTNDPSIALQGAEIFGEYPLKVADAVGDTTYIVTTPGEYKYVGNLEVAFDENGKVIAIGEDSNPILVENAIPDPTIKVIQDSVQAYIDNLATTVVAFTEVAMDGTRPAKRRFETNQGNLVADAYVWLAEKNAPNLDPNIPLLAVQNSGGMRLDVVIPANSEITVKTVRDIMAFDNDMVLMEPMSPKLFRDMLENSVSAVEDTDGRFLQISGFSFVWDTLGYPGFGRVQSAMLDDGTMMIENYEVVDGAPSVYIATNNFSAGLAGPVGDDFDEFRMVDLKANLGSSYFKAVLDYITAEDGLDSLITAAQYPEGGEGRIVRTGSVDPFAGTSADQPFDLIPIGTYETGAFDEAAAEIVAYDPASKRAFFTNADANSVTILDLSSPSFPAKVADIDMSTYGGGINSVAVSNGVVAAAVEGNGTMDNGTVVLMDTDGNVTNTAIVGVLPDMVTFTPDGTKVVTANEGEPSDDYMMDPEGSVSIVDVATGTVTNITFESLNDQKDALMEAGVRIYGPNATVAQDLEPEYIAITEDGTIAVAVLQENNALARIDLVNETLIDVVPLGYKNHGRAFQGFDASNRSAGIDIKPQPTLGMYQPDAIKSVNIDGIDYFVTANEGDSRDYDAFSEELRVGDDEVFLYNFDYPNFAGLKMDENLGRLKTTTTNPTKSITTISGQVISGQSPILSYGARSFAIWNADGDLIFDSGDFIERKTAELLPNDFNSTNDENGSFKNRSDDKGPEPEAIEIAKQGDKVFALVGLERVGGIMVFDITNPTAPAYVSYLNNRDFAVSDVTTPEAGDLGIEDIKYIPLADSPADVPLVLAANEVSGTVTIYAVNSLPTSTKDIFNVAEFEVKVGPNPFVSNMNVSYSLKDDSKVSINLIDAQGRFIQNVVNTNQQAGDFNYEISLPNLVSGTYYVLVRVNNRVAALPVVKH